MSNVKSLHIYFSDFFGVPTETLEQYGAFNISLINDLPLFVDPFLLFDSEKPEYVTLHDGVIQYVKFLRDKAVAGPILPAYRQRWFYFKEVKENWFGLSKVGNGGTGLGKDFADALIANLAEAFSNFGSETVTKSSHLEKLCLLKGGIGRDHLSDFTVNLIKKFLLEYTQAFALQYVPQHLRRKFTLDKVEFNYASQRWLRGTYELPAYGNSYVLLTPRDILTKDEAWINHADMVNRYSDICDALPDAQLRADVEAYLLSKLSEKSTERETREKKAETIAAFPQMLDYYIRQKELSADEAHESSALKVEETHEHFVRSVHKFVSERLADTVFYNDAEQNSYEASKRRVLFLKTVIEDQDGYRIFYDKSKKVINREADLQVMFRLVWFASSFSADREVNNGRGPVDFKISKGSKDSCLVEFKLASNTKLEQNLKKQVEIYQAANQTPNALKVILYFSMGELLTVQGVLKRLKLDNSPHVILIDARPDNKPSASVA